MVRKRRRAVGRYRCCRNQGNAKHGTLARDRGDSASRRLVSANALSAGPGFRLELVGIRGGGTSAAMGACGRAAQRGGTIGAAWRAQRGFGCRGGRSEERRVG